MSKRPKYNIPLKFESDGGKLTMKTVSESDGRSFKILGTTSSTVLDALGFKADEEGQNQEESEKNIFNLFA